MKIFDREKLHGKDAWWVQIFGNPYKRERDAKEPEDVYIWQNKRCSSIKNI